MLVLNGADDTQRPGTRIAAFEKEMEPPAPTGSSSTSAAPCTASPSRTAAGPDGSCVYNERAAKRAYEMMHDFFAERFAQSASEPPFAALSDRD